MIEKIVWWVDAVWGRYKLIRKLKKILPRTEARLLGEPLGVWCTHI